MTGVGSAIAFAAELLIQGKQVFMIVKEESLAPVLTLDEYEAVSLGLTGRLDCITDPFAGRGIDFSCLESSGKLQAAISRKEVFLLGFGEDILLSVHNLQIPAMVYTQAQTVYARAVLNEYGENTESLIFIPAGFNIYCHVPLIEAPEITYWHYSLLAKVYGDSIYDMPISLLRRQEHFLFVNIFSDSAHADRQLTKAAGAGDDEPPDSFWRFRLKNLLIKPHLEASGDFDLETIAVYHDHRTAVTEVPAELPVGWKEKTLINAVLVRQSVNARVMVIDSYGDQSFREYLRRNDLLRIPKLMCNFLFFTTANLVDRYNHLRSSRLQEQIRYECSHIDFYRIRQNAGERLRQTLPLYNKACIAKDYDGHFMFFNYSLGGGQIWLDDFCLSWKAADVNTQLPGEIAVYTPLYSQRDEDADPRFYCCAVGAGRLNVVLIGEKVICIRQGEVLLPSIGAVISLSGASRADWEASFNRHQEKDVQSDTAGQSDVDGRSDADGYYPVRYREVLIEPEPPAGIDRHRWEQLEWAFGGGIAMIRDGVGIFDDGEDSTGHFREEGWLSPLSIQTQESKIHDETELHPRTVLGQTEDGRLFVMVFSGRSRYSRGVTHQESCQLESEWDWVLADYAAVSCQLDAGGGYF